MADSKEIFLGGAAIAILLALFPTSKKPAPAPELCAVTIDGTTTYQEVRDIPCDELIRQALEASREAQEFKYQLPENVTVESTAPDSVPYEVPTAEPQEPAFQATPEQMSTFSEPFETPP